MDRMVMLFMELGPLYSRLTPGVVRVLIWFSHSFYSWEIPSEV